MSSTYPVIFSGPMIRAIIEGRKTQTRRLMKSQPIALRQGAVGDKWARRMIGDRLWVRETHAIVPGTAYHHDPEIPHRVSPDGAMWAVYREGWDRVAPGRWRPSVHMPRWASRLALRITDIRADRTEAQADLAGEYVISFEVCA